MPRNTCDGIAHSVVRCRAIALNRPPGALAEARRCLASSSVAISGMKYEVAQEIFSAGTSSRFLRPAISRPPLLAHFRCHRIAKRGDDSGGVHVQDRTIRHLGTGEGQRDIEAILGTTRNDVHVIVEDVLSGS